MRILAVFYMLGSIASSGAAACAIVDSDRIFASDIALQVPYFNQLSPDLVVGLSPAPGSHRTFSGHELNSIAEKAGISLDGITPSVCFERYVSPLTTAKISAAILAIPQLSNAQVQIVDFSRLPVPSGELSFPRTGLSIPSALHREDVLLWRGTVRYSPQHTIAVWVRVRIEEERPVVLATRGLGAKAVIAPSDIAMLRRAIFPFEPHLESLADVAGRITRKPIPAGSMITDALIEVPTDIAPGEIVHVTASRGSARISLDAVAITGGSKGDTILLLNPESRRRFRAVVEGKGRAHTRSEAQTL